MDIKSLKERLSAKRFALDDVVPLAEEAVKAIELLQIQLTRRDSTVDTISNALSYAERQASKYDSKAQTLENENRRLQLDLEELKHDVAEALKATSAEVSRAERIERELENEKIESATLRHGYRLVSDGYDKLKGELEEARRDVGRLNWIDEQVGKMTNVVIRPFSMDKCVVVLRLFGYEAKDCAPSSNARSAIDAARQQAED